MTEQPPQQHGSRKSENPLRDLVEQVKGWFTGKDHEDRGGQAATEGPEGASAADDRHEAAGGGSPPRYDDMTVEELRELAADKGISGRSSMTKQELVVTLAGDAERYRELTVEQLRDLAGKRDVEGRWDMTKDELVDALTAGERG